VLKSHHTFGTSIISIRRLSESGAIGLDKWERRLLAFSEREQKSKEYYENGDRALMETPMSYEQYHVLAEEGRVYEDKLSSYYSYFTKNEMGNTNKEVEKIANGDRIAVVRAPSYCYPILHDHEYVEIIYVYRGSCRHYIREMNFEMQEGDLCIIPPKVSHTIINCYDGLVIVNILVSSQILDQSFLRMIRGSDMLREFFSQMLYHKRISPYILFHTGKDPVMHQRILDLYREDAEKSYAYNESMRHYLALIFIYLIRHYEMQAIVADPVDATMNDSIISILGYMSVNYSHCSLNELATFFGYSSNHISRMLRSYTGKTFKSLITDLQMENAKKMLDANEMSITEISQEVGCFDSSHFSHKFHSFYGISPEEYRKQKHGKGGE